MNMHKIIPLLLVGVLSIGTGLAAGYTMASGSQEPFTESAGLPVHYMASVSASAAALRGYLTDPYADESVTDTNRPRYMLGTDHGFVTVFYIQDDPGQTLILKERTRTPENTLSSYEREQLSDGIYIYTEEQLVKILQDYDS